MATSSYVAKPAGRGQAGGWQHLGWGIPLPPQSPRGRGPDSTAKSGGRSLGEAAGSPHGWRWTGPARCCGEVFRLGTRTSPAREAAWPCSGILGYIPGESVHQPSHCAGPFSEEWGFLGCRENGKHVRWRAPSPLEEPAPLPAPCRASGAATGAAGRWVSSGGLSLGPLSAARFPPGLMIILHFPLLGSVCTGDTLMRFPNRGQRFEVFREKPGAKPGPMGPMPQPCWAGSGGGLLRFRPESTDANTSQYGERLSKCGHDGSEGRQESLHCSSLPALEPDPSPSRWAAHGDRPPRRGWGGRGGSGCGTRLTRGVSIPPAGRQSHPPPPRGQAMCEAPGPHPQPREHPLGSGASRPGWASRPACGPCRPSSTTSGSPGARPAEPLLDS